MTLRDVLNRMKLRRLDLSDGYLSVLAAAVRWFPEERLESVTADSVGTMMRRLKDAGKTAKTIRNYRQGVLYLLADAGIKIEPRDCRPPKLVRRRPTAWRYEELQRLIAACRMARWQRGWGPRHWEALTLVTFETSLRIGCLLRADIHHLDERACTLYVPGENQKNREDTVHRLRQETATMIASLPRPDDRLFPWPFNRRILWKHYGQILDRAGLPSTSRDKFHRLRRTSYTYVAVQFGKDAASEHAAHKSDLSAHYLDTSFLPKPNPLDALPRIA